MVAAGIGPPAPSTRSPAASGSHSARPTATSSGVPTLRRPGVRQRRSLHFLRVRRRAPPRGEQHHRRSQNQRSPGGCRDRRSRRAGHTLLLPARRGLAIGVAVHHAPSICCDSSSTRFRHADAGASTGRVHALRHAPPLPISLLPDAFFLSTSTTVPASRRSPPEMPADQLLGTFTLWMKSSCQGRRR